MTTRDPMTRLAAERPTTEQAHQLIPPAERTALRDRILATPRQPQHDVSVAPPRRARPRLTLRSALVAVALAVVTALALTVTSGPGRPGSNASAAVLPMLAFHPTSTPTAAKLLEQLAHRAEVRPAPARRGPVAYVHTKGFGLDAAIAGHRTTSAVVARDTEKWAAVGGKVRIREVSSPADIIRVGSGETARAVAHGMGTTWDRTESSSPPDDLERLSTDPAVLAKQLSNRALAGTYPSAPLARFNWMLRVYNEQPVPPRLQAALLRLLGTMPGLVNQGTVTDRLGRHGVAVSFDEPTRGPRVWRHVLIFDPRTGATVDYETVALTTRPDQPDPFNVPMPAVTGSTAYLTAAWVPDLTTRP